MDWQQALLLSKVGKAYRYPKADQADRDYEPQLVQRLQYGKTQAHVCRAFSNAELHMTEAARFHDWHPTDPVDAVTALGNVERQSPAVLPERSRGPLETYLDEHE